MMLSESQIQNYYEGYLQTKLLWSPQTTFCGLHQFQIDTDSQLHRHPKVRLRLGQLAEQFVFNQLETMLSCDLLAENIQIQHHNQTLGELDAILKYKAHTYHLEIVYKFYLYDETIGTHEVNRWIGPNRNDSLLQKINKLKNKQLPLLYSDASKIALQHLNLDFETIRQVVNYKAQLYIPYQKTITFETINKNCVEGFYIKRNQIALFSDSEFYIPNKLEWFLKSHANVDWCSYSHFIKESESYLSSKKSPLIWIKTSENHIFKCFLVWW